MNYYIKQLVRFIYFLFHERIWKGRLKYIYKNNHNDRLVVVFSGFPNGDKPMYNYMRTLKVVKNVDQLFILDDFGYKGSYYWMENGSDYPQKLVEGLLNSFVRDKYKEIYTMGTSKGGTCAIFYGLMINAQHIYAGACQYLVGDYLNTKEHRPILEAMLGEGFSEKDILKLNGKMPRQLTKYKDRHSQVHLLYSKVEHTYQEHISFLIEDLKKNNISFTEQVEAFEKHSDVGTYFIPFIQKELSSKK